MFVVGKDNKAEKRRGQARPVDAGARRRHQRPDRGRDRGGRRHPARPAGPAGLARSRRAAGPAAGRQPRRHGGQAVISAAFIRRPRLAVVIAIVITLAGAIAMLRIPVAQFPDIVPPQRAGHRDLSRRVGRGGRGRDRPAARGADRRRRQDDLHEVDQRQRRQLQPHRLASRSAPIPTSTRSTSTTACRPRSPQLPQAVQLQGLTVIKRSSAVLQFMNALQRDRHSSRLFITNYATINVLDELSRVPGVGQALLFGKLNYSMRIWFDTQRLTSLNLAPSDVVQAIQAQNVQAPVGRIGARPVPDDQQFQLNVQTQGTPDHARAVRQDRDARQSGRLGAAHRRRGAGRDGRAERGHREPRSTASRRSASALYLAPGANAVATGGRRRTHAGAAARPLPRGSARRTSSTTPRSS